MRVKVLAFAVLVCLIAGATSFPSPKTIAARKRAHKSNKLGKTGYKVISLNRQARRNYEIMQTLEVGLSLLGSEVKSCRANTVSIQDAFVRLENGRASLVNSRFAKWKQGGEFFNHEEDRKRPVLMHKKEARKWEAEVGQKGYTVCVTKIYFNDVGLVKMEIGLAKGKNVRDKRGDIRARDIKRETAREIKSFR